MTKIKGILIDQKRHIRFGEWNGNDVSNKIIYFCFTFFSRKGTQALFKSKTHVL